MKPSKSRYRALSFPDNPIMIIHPKTGSTNIALDENCTIDVTGTVSTYNWPEPEWELTSIRASSDGMNWIDGTIGANHRDFSIPDVPGFEWCAGMGKYQILIVEGRHRNGELGVNQSDFWVTSGPAECEVYCDEEEQEKEAAGAMTCGPIQEIMPRQMLLKIEPCSGQSDWLAGGLLKFDAVCLSYDLDASTPESPVWRETVKGAESGCWFLRVVNGLHGYEAQLSLRRITERQVIPEMLAVCRRWSFRRENRFCAEIPTANSLLALTLLVSPR